eukprot:gene2076-biopygen1973
MRINAASILLSTVTLDSDHHVAPLMSYSVLLTNQNEHSHTLRQLNHAKEVYGDAYDCPERREMSDQDKSVNSNLEAMNWANDAVRQEFVSGVHTTAALLTLVKQSARRFYENKRKAHAARGPVPSAVVRKLEAVVEKAGTINSGISFVSRSDKSIARVESTTRPGVAYTRQHTSLRGSIHPQSTAVRSSGFALRRDRHSTSSTTHSEIKAATCMWSAADMKTTLEGI